MRAAMDDRPRARLGDDERRRLGQELAQLGREARSVGAAADHARGRIGQHAETRFVAGLELSFAFVVEDVIAAAEKREMVVGEPAEEGEVFREIGVLYRRRMLLELRDRFRKPSEHRLPVAHDHRNIGKNLGEPALDRGLALIVDDRIQHEDDEALVDRRAALCASARRVARIADDRVERGRDVHAVGAQLRGRGIVKERDVVIDREHHGFATREGGIGGRRFENLDQRLAEAPFGRAREHLFDERGKLRAREVDQILGRCVPRERGEECKERLVLGSDEIGARRQMRGGVHRLVSGFLVRGSQIGLCRRQSRHHHVECPSRLA